MNVEGKVDVLDLDESLESGGKINVGNDNDKRKMKSFSLFRLCLNIRLGYFLIKNNIYKSLIN